MAAAFVSRMSPSISWIMSGPPALGEPFAHSRVSRYAALYAFLESLPMAKTAAPPFRADHVGSLLRPASAQGSPAAARRGSARRGRPRGRRGPRDRARHQKAARIGPTRHHGRRAAPVVVASRFSLGPRRHRGAPGGFRHRLRRRDTAHGRRPRRRQDRLLRAPDARALPVLAANASTPCRSSRFRRRRRC